MSSHSNSKRGWENAPTWLLLSFWAVSVAEAGFFGWAAASVTPSWFETANAMQTFGDFGWEGLLATCGLALLCAASGAWGLLAYKARAVVRGRLL